MEIKEYKGLRQSRLSQLKEFIDNRDKSGIDAWCEQLCYWFDPGGWFDINCFDKWLDETASVTEEDKDLIDEMRSELE